MDQSSLFGPGYIVTKLGQRVTARFADELTALGMRPRHYGALAAIATAPAGSQMELGQRLAVVPSAIVAVVDELVSLGAVERTVDATNRRRTIITTTPDGLRLLDRAAAIGRAVDEECFAALSAEERTILTSLLARVG